MAMMIIKRNSKVSYSSKSKSFAPSSFKHYFCVFCLMFMPLYFLKSLVGAEVSSEQLSPNIVKKPNLSNSGIAMGSNHNIRRRLLQAELGVATATKDQATKDELQRIIEQIRSVTFKTDKRAIKPEPVVVPKVVPICEPNETVSDTVVQKEQEKKEIKIKLPYQPVTDKTLQTLKKLSQHHERLDNPFELGETLFLSGNLKEAVMFYQEALNRTSSVDTGPVRDRAWRRRGKVPRCS